MGPVLGRTQVLTANFLNLTCNVLQCLSRSLHSAEHDDGRYDYECDDHHFFGSRTPQEQQYPGSDDEKPIDPTAAKISSGHNVISIQVPTLPSPIVTPDKDSPHTAKARRAIYPPELKHFYRTTKLQMKNPSTLKRSREHLLSNVTWGHARRSRRTLKLLSDGSRVGARSSMPCYARHVTEL